MINGITHHVRLGAELVNLRNVLNLVDIISKIRGTYCIFHPKKKKKKKVAIFYFLNEK